MKFSERRRLIEKVKGRGRDDGIKRPVVKRQLLGGRAQELHPVGSGAGLGEHAVGHVYAVDLVRTQFTLESDR